MIKLRLTVVVLALLPISVFSQDADAGQHKLALPNHKGQLQWSAPGFKIVQSSVKPNGNEIGLRGQDEAGRVNFLGFLFLFSEHAPLTSAKCRDGVMEPEKKSNKSLKVLSASEYPRTNGPPVDLVTYTTQDRAGKTSYMVRGFAANDDICGDLEFYSDSPISAADTAIKNAFANYKLDENYVPRFNDVFVYAQMLYNMHSYKTAGPMFEAALAKLHEQPEANAKTMTRVLTDQAGMSYGISGDVPKAHAIFEKAIADDPDYPLYYYNLACADAEEKNLKDARTHLRQAFERKANVIAGESMPDPTKDDSFLPYRNNKEFWTFLEGLQPKS
jgi:tetratricopeptide (TPR) repeat protein